jgi:hypothetical protein
LPKCSVSSPSPKVANQFCFQSNEIDSLSFLAVPLHLRKGTQEYAEAPPPSEAYRRSVKLGPRVWPRERTIMAAGEEMRRRRARFRRRRRTRSAPSSNFSVGQQPHGATALWLDPQARRSSRWRNRGCPRTNRRSRWWPPPLVSIIGIESESSFTQLSAKFAYPL